MLELSTEKTIVPVAIILLFTVGMVKSVVGEGAESPISPLFVDVSKTAHLNFVHVSGLRPIKHIAETMGSGGGFLDYDNDGWLDIYLVNGGARPGTHHVPPASNRLFRNNGDGTFTDVTERAGVGGSGAYGMGCAFADYDNDGFVDIYVTNLGPNILYHNNGDGTFTDVTARAGVGDPHWSTSAAWGDYDRDGFVDLYVCNYLVVPFSAPGAITDPFIYEGAPNVLYRNTGNGTFEDVTLKAGVREDPKSSKSLGVIWFDMDNDGDVDLYVANDSTPNYLFENKGSGTFQDVSLMSGAAFSGNGVALAGMGVDAADLGNGRLDILVTNYSMQHNSLYWNEGSGMFTDRIIESGLAGPGFLPLGFGTNFFDYDNDGILDLFVANGHVLENTSQIQSGTEYRQANQLFSGRGSGRFAEVSSQAGAYFSRKNVSRGSAVGDFNNDGRVDILVTNNNGRPALLENRTPSRRDWLKLKLQGTDCNRDAIGAKITLKAGTYQLMQEIRAGSSYLSQSDLRLHFGLGNRTRVDSILVTWPCGRKQKITPPLRLDQIIFEKEKSSSTDS